MKKNATNLKGNVVACSILGFFLSLLSDPKPSKPLGNKNEKSLKHREGEKVKQLRKGREANGEKERYKHERERKTYKKKRETHEKRERQTNI